MKVAHLPYMLKKIVFSGEGCLYPVGRRDLLAERDKIIVCPVCDLLHRSRDVAPGEVLLCGRCGERLLAPQSRSVEKTLAYSLTGLLLFVPACFLPIMSLNILGIQGSGSVFQSIVTLWENGYYMVATAVGLTAFLFPLVKLSLHFLLSLFLWIGFHPPGLYHLMRWCHYVDEWAMLEVYMLGILVSIIKLHHMAHIDYNMGFACFVALMLVTIASTLAMDHHLFWRLIEDGERSRYGEAPERGGEAVHG